jgi:hypothetical protein
MVSFYLFHKLTQVFFDDFTFIIISPPYVHSTYGRGYTIKVMAQFYIFIIISSIPSLLLTKSSYFLERPRLVHHVEDAGFLSLCRDINDRKCFFFD